MHEALVPQDSLCLLESLKKPKSKRKTKAFGEGPQKTLSKTRCVLGFKLSFTFPASASNPKDLPKHKPTKKTTPG